MTNLIVCNTNNISNKQILEYLESYEETDIDYTNNIYTQALTFRLYESLLNRINIAFEENNNKRVREIYYEYDKYLSKLLPSSINSSFILYYMTMKEELLKNLRDNKITKTYIVKNSNNSLYKIGKTTQDVSERVKQWEFLACANIDETIIIEKDVELELHKIFENKRIKGEWFELSSNDIEYIKIKYLNYTEEDFE